MSYFEILKFSSICWQVHRSWTILIHCTCQLPAYWRSCWWASSRHWIVRDCPDTIIFPLDWWNTEFDVRYRWFVGRVFRQLWVRCWWNLWVWQCHRDFWGSVRRSPWRRLCETNWVLRWLWLICRVIGWCHTNWSDRLHCILVSEWIRWECESSWTWYYLNKIYIKIQRTPCSRPGWGRRALGIGFVASILWRFDGFDLVTVGFCMTTALFGSGLREGESNPVGGVDSAGFICFLGLLSMEERRDW